MGQSKEHYNPKPMAANSSVDCGVSLAGFLCTVAGTLTVTDASDGTVLVNALPVVTGPFIRLPILFKSSAGGKVTLAGGAAGTLLT